MVRILFYREKIGLEQERGREDTCFPVWGDPKGLEGGSPYRAQRVARAVRLSKGRPRHKKIPSLRWDLFFCVMIKEIKYSYGYQ